MYNEIQVQVTVDVDSLLELVEDSDLLDEVKNRELGQGEDRESLLKILFENENISLFDNDKINFLIDNISKISLESLEKLV